MFCITVTVTNDTDPECCIHTLRLHHNHADNIVTLSPEKLSEKVNVAINMTKEIHAATFPRNKSFVLPVVNIEITPNASGAEIAAGDILDDAA